MIILMGFFGCGQAALGCQAFPGEWAPQLSLFSLLFRSLLVTLIAWPSAVDSG